MFFRIKQSDSRQYLQIVENFRDHGRVRQRVLTTLGRMDELQQSGHIAGLLASGARFADHVLLLTAHRNGQAPAITTRRIGPTLIFERLWQETGCQRVLAQLLAKRSFDFSVERAVFLTVLHRLCATGSDRAGQRWKEDYLIDGADDLELHQMYRAMAWLGEELPAHQQQGSSKLVPRCSKDVIEEQLFAHRRDLFSALDIVFFDTTSLYFEGEGGTLGQYGHSKDHRPDLHQMIVGVVLDGEGRPLCCELWPGNTADVTTLLPIVDRLRQRFHIVRVCIVADRGMISAATLQQLEETHTPYILGARMRQHVEVREHVLADKGRFRVVHGPRQQSTDPAPLKVKEVHVDERRYVVCVNQEQVETDRVKREQIVAALREQLAKGDKSLVGNKGYRHYLKVEGDSHFAVDEAKLQEEARYDGTWVVRTGHTDLSAPEVALQYKKLWMVEQWFRDCKSLLETRPIYHHRDETSRGHVFCSFLALVLRQELQARLAARGHHLEWAEVKRDLERVQYVEVSQGDKHYLLRSELQGTAGRVFQSVGVAAPPTVQEVE